MVLEKELEIKVGMYETHSISYSHDRSADTTVIIVDDNEIFRSRMMNGYPIEMRIEQSRNYDQWFYSFIVGTQETHVIEIHVRKNKPSKKVNHIHHEYNLLVDGILMLKKGKRLDPHKSGTRSDIILEHMSRDHFHILSETEKKLFARDILKDPNWRIDWVYVQ